MLLLWAPMLNERLKVLGPYPLKGNIIEVSDVDFSLLTWWGGIFSEGKEKYIEQHFGLRDYLIRIYNQLAFILWKFTNADSMIIGKNNYIYAIDYIEAVEGKDYIGHNRIADQTTKLRLIQDTLEKLNITLLVVLAPGKGNYFPEYIPDIYYKKNPTTNFADYKIELAKKKVHNIDFNTWFIKNKFISKYPLYPQCGVHWSMYGSWLVADSIVKKIEAIRNIDLPDAKMSFLSYPESARFDDYDAGDVLNLLFMPDNFKMAYPYTVMEKDSVKHKLDAIIIADSYYWQIKSSQIPAGVFNNETFWFYNRVLPGPVGKPRGLKGLALKNEIDKNKVIIILSNTVHLKELGWGFIDDAYALYFGTNKISQF